MRFVQFFLNCLMVSGTGIWNLVVLLIASDYLMVVSNELGSWEHWCCFLFFFSELRIMCMILLNIHTIDSYFSLFKQLSQQIAIPFPTEIFKLMNEVENEDLVFTLETIVDKFGEEMAPYALGLCQNLVMHVSIVFLSTKFQIVLYLKLSSMCLLSGSCILEVYEHFRSWWWSRWSWCSGCSRLFACHKHNTWIS